MRPARHALAALGIGAVCASAQAITPQETASMSSVVSDGTLGTPGSTVVPVSFEGGYQVRGVRISGTFVQNLDTSSATEARILITAPSGATTEIQPFTVVPPIRPMAFFDVFYALSADEPFAAGEWTFTFYESADQEGEDGLWESVQFTLDDEPAPPPGPPDNDSPLSARPIDGLETVAFSTIDAQTDPLPVDCGPGVGIFNDIWFSMTPVQTELVSLSLCGSASFDTVISVHAEDGAFTTLACDDDGCGVQGGSSDLSFEAVAGSRYLIRVGGSSPGALGTGMMNIVLGGPACVATNPGGGYRPGHTWGYASCNVCRYVHKMQSQTTVSSTTSGFTRKYTSCFGFDRDCFVNETVYDQVRYDVVFWVSAGANQPWMVRVDTRRTGNFIIDNDGPNASTVYLGPVTGFVTSYVPVGNTYVPGNASMLSGTMSTGTTYGWSEGNSSCVSQGFNDTSTGVITGTGSQSVHLNFDWNANLTSGDEVGIRMGNAGGSICGNLNDVGYYPGCNGANGSNDGHFVTVTCLRANDICQRCTTVGLGTTFDSNVGANTDSSSSCGGESDVFYCFRPSCNGPVTINTCGSSFDTLLSVYAACPAGPGNEIACNDDAFTGPCAGSSQSQLTFNASGCGQTYYIRVAGFGTDQGNIVLNISQATPAPPVNDACANAQPVGTGSYAFTTCGATPDGPGFPCPGGPDVWFRYTPSCYGTATISTCGSCFDSAVSVYTGVCGALTPVVCGSFNGGFCPGQPNISVVAPSLSPCKTYYIRVSAEAGPTGAGTLTITQSGPSNNSCGAATNIGPGTVYGGTTCATVDGSNGCGYSNFAPDVWYAYTPSCAGQVTIDTCLPPECGNRYDTVLSVHTACTGTALNQIACNDDAFCNNGYPWNSRVTFNAQCSVRYLIRVAGYAGQTGNFALTLSQATGAPPNDLCANATPINANSSVSFSSCAANTDGPTSCPVFGDVWYSFTACTNGVFTASTCGSPAGQNTSLAIYAGSCGSLVPIQCNDNNGPACFGLYASASWSASIGQTYLIRVGSPTPGVGVCGTLTVIGNNPATPQCPPGGSSCTKMYQIVGSANGLPWVYRLTSVCCFDLCRTHPGVGAGLPASAIASSFAANINSQCGGVNLSATSSGDYIIIKTRGCACNLTMQVGQNGTPCGQLCTVTGATLPTSGPCAFNPEIVEVDLSGHDCNGNGQDDTIDILTGETVDSDGDGVPDDCVRFAGDPDKCELAGEPEDALVIRPDLATFLGRPNGNNAQVHGGQPLPFDTGDPDRWTFGYTFQELDPIIGGTLEVHVKAGPFGPADDSISLQFFRPPPSFVWSSFLRDLEAAAGGDGVWANGDDLTFTLDLSSLPMPEGLPPVNLIDRINTDGFLDVYIQNGTAVDYLKLTLDRAPSAAGACCLDRCTCVQAGESECAAQGGVFLGEGTACSGSPQCYPSPACPCDWNGADGLDSQDFFDFLEGFFSGTGDFNCADGTDSQDYFDYIECFFAPPSECGG